MARPKKQTVDYFPHYVNPSKTLRILQTQHGNDGYAFWFKMLQILGRTEGHAYDYNKAAEWMDLVTETHVPEAKAEQILETLASLDMIDKELWGKKIIWVQHFVDEHAALYARRKVDIPLRPGSPTILSAPQPDETPVFTEDLKVAPMIACFEKGLKRIPSPSDLRNIVDIADNYPDGWFEKAVDEAVKNKARSPMRYIEKILLSWKEEGVNPLDETKRTRRTAADGGSTTSVQSLRSGITGPID